MDTVQALFIIACVLFIGAILLFNIFKILELYTNKKYSVSSLFIGFKQKMWMTAGLGLTFFGFYLILVFFGSSKLDSELKLKLFLDAYHNPISYVYMGLFFFVGVSISIILIRMLIKSIYQSKKR